MIPSATAMNAGTPSMMKASLRSLAPTSSFTTGFLAVSFCHWDSFLAFFELGS